MVNNKRNKVTMEMEEGTLKSHQKVGFTSQSVKCDLVDDVKMFIRSGRVIACDPREAILDNQLSEDHVGMSILYYLNNISVVMMIWKWPLV